jgi:site-specific recombinase XerD
LTASGRLVRSHVWHMLRHTFASHFMMAGGNILTLQQLLGHATLDMTMRYAHLAPDHLAGELGRMSFAPARENVTDFDAERIARTG